MQLYKMTPLLIALLCGCAGTRANVVNPYTHSPEDRFAFEILNLANAPEAGISVLRDQLARRQADTTVDPENPTRTVTIEIKYYYARPGASRDIFGIMAGSDNVTTTTTIKDVDSGEILGNAKHVTRNPSLLGINALIRKHADQIVDFVLSKGT